MSTLAALTILKNLIEFMLPLIPDDGLKLHLTDVARAVDDKLVDIALAAKFPAD